MLANLCKSLYNRKRLFVGIFHLRETAVIFCEHFAIYRVNIYPSTDYLMNWGICSSRMVG